jgi:hypothetical protein
MKMNENNITMFEWMYGTWMAPALDALKYHIGQRVNYKDAKKMVHMIADSVGYDMKTPCNIKNFWKRDTPYRRFIYGCLYLIVAADDEDDFNGWRRTIWKALSEKDQDAMETMVLRELGFSMLDLVL